MPTGTAWPNGGNLALWHLNYKINTDERGFNMGFMVAEVVEATARAVGTDLGKRILALLPSDAEIFYASMSRDDHAKDSRFMPDVIGPGTYTLTGSSPPPSTYDFPRTSLLYRLESTDGQAVTRKFCPLPDDKVNKAALITPISNVVGVPGALPALPLITDAWELIFLNFFKAVVLQTHHVYRAHAPGGAYTYFPWINCYPLRIGSKKGGRVFI
jgi:hypothetical protein